MFLKRFLVGFLLLGIVVSEESSAFVAPKKSVKPRNKAKSAKALQQINKVLVSRAEADYKRHDRDMRYSQFQQMQHAQHMGMQQQLQAQQKP